MGIRVPHSTHVTVAGELRPTLLRIPPKPCCLSNRLSPNVFSSAVNGRERNRCGPVWLLARQKEESLLRGHREGRSSRKPRSRQEGIALQRESAHQASGLHLRSSSRCSASEQSNRDLRRQTHPASCPNRKGGSAARRFGSRPQPRPDHGARSICRALTSCETACPVPAASTPPAPTRSRRWRRK
jgi:hypothetical protein